MNSAEMQYVGFWARVGAFILDSILMLIVIIPPLIWIYGWEELLDPNSSFVAGPADFLISWVFPAVAYIFFWVRVSGTPGKLAIGARIVDASTGAPISILQAVIRYLGYFVSTLPLFLGLIWVAFDSRKQGWHDKLARTVVIRARSSSAPIAIRQ